MIRRVYLHRGLWHLEPMKAHMIIGAAASLVIAVLIVIGAETFWNFQKNVVQELLNFAHVRFSIDKVPFNDLRSGLPVFYKPGGNVFSIPVKFQAMRPELAIVASIVLALIGFFSYRLKRLPLPFKVLILFLLTLFISTILYTSFVSPIPPHSVNRLAIDWQFSGIIVLFLIPIIFTFAVFPIQGPLWAKFFWLAMVLIYAVVWNSLRLSVVLGSLYYLGSSVFLVTHYLTGIYIDFIYIVAFYSLALAHLAKLETSEVGW